MTIIKDLIILNDSNFYLTKEDKTIKNEYNTIGKSYNKKEKYKTQETNYELSLEYVLNLNKKEYFFNLLNDNNYFLYRSKESFNCSLFYFNNETNLFIDFNNDILKSINIFNYTKDNRLYLLINNKKYSFKFDETYDYQLNNKYKLIDEISLQQENLLNNVNADILYLSILINNSIKFKFLTDNKYSLSFDIETINNIISSLSINNVIESNNINETSYVENYGLYKDLLYTKLLKLNNNHFIILNIYNLINETSTSYNLNSTVYIYISYKKIYINENNEIESSEEFYSLLDFNNKIKYSDFGEDQINKRELLKYIDLNLIKNDNEIYLNFSLSKQEVFYNNFKEYNNALNIFEYKKSKYINNILFNNIEYFKYEITDKKLNITNYKKSEIESLVDYKKIKELDLISGGWGITIYDLYQSNIHSNMYIYNNLLYVSNIVNSKIITNQYNKNDNTLKEINNKIISLNNNYNYYSSYDNINYDNERYNYYFRSKEEDINYNIINKSNYYNFSKQLSTNYKNENLMIEEENTSDLININKLMPSSIGYYGNWNNINTIQKTLVSNNKKIFLNIKSQFGINGTINTFFQNLYFLNNNNEIQNITNINFENGIINDFDTKQFVLNNKDNIKFYYNTTNNKYYLFMLINNNYINLQSCYIRIFEFTYDNVNTLNITKLINLNNSPKFGENNMEKCFCLYFDETINKYYINIKYKHLSTDNHPYFLDTEQTICLNEDLTINFDLKETNKLTY